MAIVTGSNPLLDRPQLAVSNLMGGDLWGVVQSLWDPKGLTPEQRTDAATRLGLDQSIAGPVINILSNPLVAGSILMSMKTRPIHASELSAWQGEFRKKYFSLLGMGQLSSVSENLRGTPLANTFGKVVERIKKIDNEFSVLWGQKVGEFEKKFGRRETIGEMRDAVELQDRTFRRHELAEGERFDPFHVHQKQLDELVDRVAEGRRLTREHRQMIERLDAAGFTPSEAAALWRQETENLQARALTPEKASEQARWLQANLVQPLMEFKREFFTREKAVTNALVKAYYRVQGKSDDDLEKITKDVIREVENYWVHMPDWSEDQARRYMNQYARNALLAGDQSARKFTASVMTRKGLMLPSRELIAERGASEGFLRIADTVVPEFSNGGRGYYSLNFQETMPRDIRNLAQAYAWHVPFKDPENPGTRTKVSPRDITNEWLDKLAKGTPREQNLVATIREVTLPQLLGGMTDREASMAAQWAAKMDTAIKGVEWVESKFGDLGGTTTILKKWLGSKAASWGSVQHGAASWLYTGTLGFPNIGSPIRNTFQPFLSAGVLAPDDMIAGTTAGYRKMLGYAKARFIDKMSPVEAMKQELPDIWDMSLELEAPMQEALAKELDTVAKSVQAQGGLGKLTQIGKRTLDTLMLPFQGSELANRVVTYEVFKAKALRELPGTDFAFLGKEKPTRLPLDSRSHQVEQAAKRVAQEMVYFTQFGAGPLHGPMLTQQWSPLSRQLTSYTLRQLAFLGQLASNPSTGWRTLAIAATTGAAAKELIGNDPTGLIFPNFIRQEGPFAPLPVPPAWGLVGGAAMWAAGGDSENVRRALAPAIPGGVGASQVAGLVPGGQPVAQFFEKPYADYNNMTPDGQVPLYTSKGSLIGYRRITDILMAQVGGLGDPATEREAQVIKWLMGQRDAIRGYKTRLLDAMYSNDESSITAIQNEWSRKFPGLGGIPVTKADIRSLHTRRDISRVEKVLETLPPEVRGTYAEAVDTAFANNPEFFGLRQGLGAAPSITLREPYRLIPRESVESAVNPSRHGMKLSDKLKQASQAASYGTGTPQWPNLSEQSYGGTE